MMLQLWMELRKCWLSKGFYVHDEWEMCIRLDEPLVKMVDARIIVASG